MKLSREQIQQRIIDLMKEIAEKNSEIYKLVKMREKLDKEKLLKES